MTINQYALLKEDNTIANIIVVDSEDIQVLDELTSFNEASYYLNIDEVGLPKEITDTWNPSTSSWESVPVIFDPNSLDWSTAQIVEENKR
jgi:hypothetical protein